MIKVNALAGLGLHRRTGLADWVDLQLPQLIANYKAKSADGLSMAFLIVWLLGDTCNFIGKSSLRSSFLSCLSLMTHMSGTGALFTKLAPSAIALATYFCFLDIVLISQTGYYKAKAARRRATAHNEALHGARSACEESPLLGQRRSSIDLPGSPNRHDTHRESALEPIRKEVTSQDGTHGRRTWLNNLLALMAVYIVGFTGWLISYKAGAWHGDDGIPNNGPSVPDPSDADELKAKLGLALGYASAFFYLW